MGAAQAISLRRREREAALPNARTGLGPRGAGILRARTGLPRSRDRRGDEAGGDGAADRPFRLLLAPHPGPPPRSRGYGWGPRRPPSHGSFRKLATLAPGFDRRLRLCFELP